jgi:hypothetical protein
MTWHIASEKRRGIQSGSRVGGKLIVVMEDLSQNPSTEATSCGRCATLIRPRTYSTCSDECCRVLRAVDGEDRACSGGEVLEVKHAHL